MEKDGSQFVFPLFLTQLSRFAQCDTAAFAPGSFDQRTSKYGNEQIRKAKRGELDSTIKLELQGLLAAHKDAIRNSVALEDAIKNSVALEGAIRNSAVSEEVIEDPEEAIEDPVVHEEPTVEKKKKKKRDSRCHAPATRAIQCLDSAAGYARFIHKRGVVVPMLGKMMKSWRDEAIG